MNQAFKKYEVTLSSRGGEIAHASIEIRLPRELPAKADEYLQGEILKVISRITTYQGSSILAVQKIQSVGVDIDPTDIHATSGFMEYAPLEQSAKAHRVDTYYATGPRRRKDDTDFALESSDITESFRRGQGH